MKHLIVYMLGSLGCGMSKSGSLFFFTMYIKGNSLPWSSKSP